MKSLILVMMAGALLCAPTIYAQPQQSENFRITKSAMDAGGGASSSADFRLCSAFGQPTPVGMQSSTNFTLYAGYLSPSFAVSPLSAIQRLVIKYNSPNVRLDWERIATATSYTVYRDTIPTFAPGPLNQIGTASDTFYVDLNALSLPKMRYFYNVESSRTAIRSAARRSADQPVEPAASIGQPAAIEFPTEVKQVPAAKRIKQM